MTNQSASSRGNWSPPQRDDPWGASTVHGGQQARPRPASRPLDEHDPWSAPSRVSGRDERTARRSDARIERQIEGMRSPRQVAAAPARPRERGMPWWAALLLLIVIAVIGGLIDTIGSIDVKGGFNIGIVVASVIAILVVRRSHMFPIVIAPPIVYSLAAVFQLYIRSSGLHDKKVVFDAAANYLVYGFPAIAIATAAVLIIAGVRMISRK